MKTVTLKARHGPTQLRIHIPVVTPEGYTMSKPTPVVFSLDNDCRAVVPEWWWLKIQDELFDPISNLRFKEEFQTL